MKALSITLNFTIIIVMSSYSNCLFLQTSEDEVERLRKELKVEKEKHKQLLVAEAGRMVTYTSQIP